MLDTDVVSRTSPVARDGGRVGEWLMRHKGLSFISVATLIELVFGVDRLELRSAHGKANVLGVWLDRIEEAFSARLLMIDARVAMRTGHLLTKAEAAGVTPGIVDASIAACAELTDRTVVIFNTRHFSAFGVPFRTPEDRR